MKNPPSNEITRLINAFGYSLKGLKAAFKHEAAFRIETIFALIFIPLAFFVGEGWLEIAVLLAVLFLVMLVELVNSAIEAVVDRIGDDYHKLSGRAKDQASAAVLFALIIAAIVWAALVYKNFIGG